MLEQSDSEFMEFVQNLMLNYWSSKSSEGDKEAEIRLESYGK